MSILRRSAFIVLLIASGAGLAACENTIRGAGKDIDQTADAVGDATEEVAQ